MTKDENEQHLAVDHLSPSQISLYLNCSLKYRFEYIDQIPKPFKPSGLVFGSVIHSSLDWLHKQMIQDNDFSLEKLLKIFETDWYAQKVETDIRYKNGETEQGLTAMGRQMLTQYYHSLDGKPLDAEIPFSIPLIEPDTGEVLEPYLNGMIDLLDSEGIAEFKTSAKSMNDQDVKDSLQLTCYAYAYELLYQTRPKKLRIVNLVKNRTPRIISLEASRGRQDFKRLFYLASEVVHGINSRVFLPKASYMCKTCEYEEICSKWKGNSK